MNCYINLGRTTEIWELNLIVSMLYYKDARNIHIKVVDGSICVFFRLPSYCEKIDIYHVYKMDN